MCNTGQGADDPRVTLSVQEIIVAPGLPNLKVLSDRVREGTITPSNKWWASWSMGDRAAWRLCPIRRCSKRRVIYGENSETICRGRQKNLLSPHLKPEKMGEITLSATRLKPNLSCPGHNKTKPGLTRVYCFSVYKAAIIAIISFKSTGQLTARTW